MTSNISGSSISVLISNFTNGTTGNVHGHSVVTHVTVLATRNGTRALFIEIIGVNAGEVHNVAVDFALITVVRVLTRGTALLALGAHSLIKVSIVVAEIVIVGVGNLI